MLNSKISQKKPAIFLFGWLGAKKYNMHKISKFYTENMNVDVFPYIQTPQSLLNMSRDKGLDDLYERALGRPLIFHIFSLNGASAFYKSFAANNFKIEDINDKKEEDLSKNDLKLILKPNLDIRGIIYDCTPGRVNRSLYHRAFSNAIFPKSHLLRQFISIALTPIFDTFLFFARKHRKISSLQLQSLYNDPLKYPSLLFTSLKDDLIPSKDVLEYADDVRKRGVPVQTCVFKDSTHVKGYHDHRDFYRRTITKFAKMCLYDRYCLINKSYDQYIY